MSTELQDAAAAGRIRVLIVASDAVANALLGMLLDPARYDPVFPRVGETAASALERVRAPVVLLLDGTLAEADSDALFTRATRQAAVVVLFAPPARAPEVHDIAGRRAVDAFTLPIDQSALSSVLSAATARAITSGLWLVLIALSALGPTIIGTAAMRVSGG